MMSQLVSCSVGNFLFDECHKLSYVNKIGLIGISDLTIEEKDLLLWRCGLQPVDGVATLSSDASVCFHHRKIYLEKYAFLQKSCCDPFNVHKKTVKGSLREIDISLSRKVKLLGGRSIKPGQKMCPRCITAVSKEHADDSDLPETSVEYDDYHPPEEYEREKAHESINKSFFALGRSPLKDMVGIGEAKRKLSQGHCKLTEQMGKYLKVSADKLTETPSTCGKCTDLDKLVDDLKAKCAVSSQQKQVAILTLAPSSWTIKRTAEEFNVSEYKVKQARDLMRCYGILSEPGQKKGKQLSENAVQLVREFYESDEYSRLCPGKKDYVSVKNLENGERIQMQKRLLLCNLSELYALFKKQNPNINVGKSKFFELRPRWCITVGARGMHTVCVCMTHQNVKLLLTAIGGLYTNYKEAMNLIVCDINSKQCMVHRCEECPGKEAAAEAILARLKEELLLDEDDTITFKQWEHTDRTTIITRLETVQDFVAKLCDQLNTLTTHHFIAIAQAAYLRYCKENLDDATVLVLLDFAENYSFVVQDAVQGYHWDNSQATLHPFAIYYRNGNEISVISICVISDCLTHDSVTVHAFQRVVINHIKSILPAVKKVIYYSDGAASQYKNCKNFKNLCIHLQDFGLTAEWNFFATSHGKSVCDGIGGTIKRLATRASFQQLTSGHILTPLQLFQWANENVQGIKSLYVTSKEVEECGEQLSDRLKNVATIAGTRSHHFFLPSSEHDLYISRLSSPEHRVMISAHISEAPHTTYLQGLGKIKPGQYVAAVYENKWYIGCITEKSEEHQDFHVNFMAPPGPSRSFSWPKDMDECWVPSSHILMCIPVPVTSSSGRQYKLSDEVFERIGQSWQKFCIHLVQ